VFTGYQSLTRQTLAFRRQKGTWKTYSRYFYSIYSPILESGNSLYYHFPFPQSYTKAALLYV